MKTDLAEVTTGQVQRVTDSRAIEKELIELQVEEGESARWVSRVKFKPVLNFW